MALIYQHTLCVTEGPDFEAIQHGHGSVVQGLSFCNIKMDCYDSGIVDPKHSPSGDVSLTTQRFTPGPGPGCVGC